MTRSLAAIVAVGVVLAPTDVRANDDPHFVDEGFRREGLMFGFAGGGGSFFSTDCCEIGGRRGAASGGLRVGTPMGPRTLWVLQADAGSVFVKEQATEKLKFNRHVALTLGLQHYVVDTVFVRAGLGFATYTIAENDDRTAEVNLERSGYAVASSLGYEFFHWPNAFFRWRQDLAISLEVGVVAGYYPGGEANTGGIDSTSGEKLEQDTGLIVQLHTGLGFVWY